jgi:hypothetical protein
VTWSSFHSRSGSRSADSSEFQESDDLRRADTLAASRNVGSGLAHSGVRGLRASADRRERGRAGGSSDSASGEARRSCMSGPARAIIRMRERDGGNGRGDGADGGRTDGRTVEAEGEERASEERCSGPRFPHINACPARAPTKTHVGAGPRNDSLLPPSPSCSAHPLVCLSLQPCASPFTSRAQSTSEPLRPGHSADTRARRGAAFATASNLPKRRHGGQWLSARYHVPDLGSASGGGLPRPRRSARTMVDGCLPTTPTSTSTRRWPPHQWSLVRAWACHLCRIYTSQSIVHARLRGAMHPLRMEATTCDHCPVIVLAVRCASPLIVPSLSATPFLFATPSFFARSSPRPPLSVPLTCIQCTMRRAYEYSGRCRGLCSSLSSSFATASFCASCASGIPL